MQRFLLFLIPLITLISLISLITPSPILASVLINEISPNSGDDWVELYNTDGNSVDISGWILDDSGTSSDMLTIPQESTMSAQGFKLFYVGNRLNQDGDTVTLLNSNRSQQDSQNYGSGIDNGKSLGRYGDGSSNWQTLQNPTPGSSNSSGNPLTNPSPSPSPSPDPSPSPSPSQAPTSALATPTPKPSSPKPSPTKKPSPSPSPSEDEESPPPTPRVLGKTDESSPSPSPQPKKSFQLTKGAIVSYSLVGSGLLFLLAAGIPLILRRFHRRFEEE